MAGIPNIEKVNKRRLVAPELLRAFDEFPSFQLSNEVLAMLRHGIESAPKPTLSAEQHGVSMEEHRIIGAEGAPDAHVLVYTPNGQAGKQSCVFALTRRRSAGTENFAGLPPTCRQNCM